LEVVHLFYNPVVRGGWPQEAYPRKYSTTFKQRSRQSFAIREPELPVPMLRGRCVIVLERTVAAAIIAVAAE
jgi:hypothetical protein